MFEALETRRREADELYEERRWDEALSRYEELLESAPADAVLLNRVARIHAIRGRIGRLVETCFRWQRELEAQERWELASQVSHAVRRFQPGSVDARTALLRHLQSRGDEEGYLQQARIEARYFMEVGLGEVSIQVLDRARELFPENLDVAVDLADMCVAQGHLQDAVQQFRRLVARFESLDMRDRAADAYRRLKLLLPEAPDVSLNLGRLHMEQGRLDEAVVEFRSVLRSNLGHREALLGLGDASMQKGSQRDAILAYRRILTADPQDVEARQRLGRAFLAQGMRTEALAELLTAASALVELREFEEARQAYADVLEMDPQNPTAVREISNLAALARQELEARPLREPPPAPPGPEVAEPTPTPSAEESAPLTGPPEEAPEPAPSVSPSNGARLEPERILVRPNLGGGVLAPTPVLFVDRWDLLQRIQEEIGRGPDPGSLPWKPLPPLERVAAARPRSVAPSGEPRSAQVESRFGSGVRSAFGASGDFSQAFTSGGGRRRRSMEFMSSEPGARGQEPAPDSRMTLAERIAARAAAKAARKSDA